MAIEYFSDEGQRIVGFLYQANNVNGKLKARDDFFADQEDLLKEAGVKVIKLFSSSIMRPDIFSCYWVLLELTHWGPVE